MDVNMNSIAGVPHTYFNKITTNPYVLFVLAIVIVLYYLVFSGLGESSSYGEGGSVVALELFLWGVFVLLVLLNGITIFFNIDVTAGIKKLFTRDPEVSLVAKPNNPEFQLTLKKPKEVFHIPDNIFTYEDAKAICKSHDGRLATYNEISNAYDKGADWCSFGWSEDQMALYPTQQSKWKNLQTIEGHEHDCGRPGINGGYIDNPNVRFGVNCFGYKPDITEEELYKMNNSSLYQKTDKEVKFDQRVDYWRNKIPKILISPFNSNSWNIV